jgi:hypothetical protein
VDKGELVFQEESDVKISFEAVGIKEKAKVRDLWSHKELGTFNGEFSQKLKLHGAGLYWISPVE